MGRRRQISQARLNNSDVPFYSVEYMFYHTSSMEGNILHFVLTAFRLYQTQLKFKQT